MTYIGCRDWIELRTSLGMPIDEPTGLVAVYFRYDHRHLPCADIVWRDGDELHWLSASSPGYGSPTNARRRVFINDEATEIMLHAGARDTIENFSLKIRSDRDHAADYFHAILFATATRDLEKSGGRIMWAVTKTEFPEGHGGHSKETAIYSDVSQAVIHAHAAGLYENVSKTSPEELEYGPFWGVEVRIFRDQIPKYLLPYSSCLADIETKCLNR